MLQIPHNAPEKALHSKASSKKKGAKPVVKATEKRDFFRMRYFRFACYDIERTIELYKSFGMTLMYDQVQERYMAPVAVAPKKEPNGRRSSQVPLELPNAAPALTPEEIHELSLTKRIVGFTYGDSNAEIEQNRVHIIFEETEIAESAVVDLNNESNVADFKIDDAKEPHQYEYLVIYVTHLTRLLRKIAGKKYNIILEETEFDGVKMAILQDPNGIHVRLIELTMAQIGEGNHGQVTFTIKLVSSKIRILCVAKQFGSRVCLMVRVTVSSKAAKG